MPNRRYRSPKNLATPFQNVSYIDKRLLTLDSPDTEPMLTLEKQRMVIDWYVRWRITDPRAYIRNVGLDEATADRDVEAVHAGRISGLREILCLRFFFFC